MALDTKLDFSLHLKNVQNRVYKTTGLSGKLQNTLPRTWLITISNSFRPHLDYGNIIFEWAYSTLFHQNSQSIQYSITITGTVIGTSREKLYQEKALNLFKKDAGIENLVAYSK